ncbi:Protein red1 [Stagonosporopsis vannaccii]|nr:Protein red1 [Stagonosporopsis vannaccii]
MANSNFPPGMPFPFPFPQMQQPQHAPQQDGQPPALPPPPAWNLPGLQQYPPQPHAPQPGHVENQRNLPQFPSSSGLSWPPHLPPEWLQLMQSGMQNGMIPPPMPGLGFPPPSLPHPPQAPATPIALPPHFASQPGPAPSSAAPIERVQEVMDSEREDGEVSDAEAILRAPSGPAGVAIRQRYEPPRSAPQPPTAPSHVEDAYNPDKPSAGQTTQKPPTVNRTQQANTAASETDLVQQQREEAKQFIRLLNANNVGYHALAKENIDLELLRSLYRSMNLPSEPEPIPPPKTNGTAASKPPTDHQTSTTATGGPQKAVPSVSTNVATAATTSSAAPSPVDRKDYLARLQAAKLARQSAPAKISSPQDSPSAAAGSPATGVSTPQATMTPTKKPPATDEQKARQTELIKQRLVALKAQSKQNAASSNNAAPKFASLQNAVPQPQTPGAGSAAPQYTGMPGLFINAPSSTSNGTSTSSRQPQAVPQNRPAPSDTSVSTPRGSVTPYNRSSGQSPYAHQDDSMIIEVSDEESNGSDMDIDDEHGTSGPSVIRQPPVSVPGFPPRPVAAAASAASTPGPQTPATLARTGELSTKEQELAALKLTLKKKLAEQKRIKEAAASATALSETPSKQSQATTSSATTTAATPAVSSTSSSDLSRERRRRRRTEIQEQLPSLDDEIASNEAEMARLAKDLERLKANNERIMRDKERLTKELEDLGIHTEGMSHADMQATKDEIERAKSPENESFPKTANLQDLSTHTASGDSATSPTRHRDVPSTGPTTLQTPTSVMSLPKPSQFGFLPGLGQAAPNVFARTAPESALRSTQNPFTSALQELQPKADHSAPAETPRDTDKGHDRASATPMDDEEDFYSPPPVEAEVNVDATVVQEPEPQVEKVNATAISPSEEDEVEMSESSEEEDEEEYEPEEPAVDETIIENTVVDKPVADEHVSEPASQQAQLPGPTVEQQSLGQSQVSTEDEEAYEPPDVDEEMNKVVPASGAAQPEGVQPDRSSPGDVDDGAMDIATSSDDSSDNSDSESDGETESELGSSESHNLVIQQDTNIADDLAPQLQPETSAAIGPAAEQLPEVPGEEEPKPPAFTPYESPLRMFKSYRYHPNFSQDVDGGFLSMTYSHQIDSDKPLCPFESAGGSCNDPECPNQHFRSMGITGEKLLVQLGTANPGKTQEEKQQWNDGLRTVLKDLRQRNIKDPKGIALEIAKYRRQFLNDDTRVVNL